MKKFILFIGLLPMAMFVKAENLIETTLLNHVETVTQFRSGETKVALLDSVILIGKYNGSSILNIQVGLDGNTKPEAGQAQSVNYLAGAMLRVDPFLRPHIKLPAHWEFIRSLNHGAALYYDFRNSGWYGGYNVGLAFDLNPRI